MIKTFEEFWNESGLEYIASGQKEEFELAYTAALDAVRDHFTGQDLPIRSYDEHFGDENFEGFTGAGLVEKGYKAGIQEAATHFEMEKITIHEYYSEKLAELFDQEPYKGTEDNGGKLT